MLLIITEKTIVSRSRPATISNRLQEPYVYVIDPKCLITDLGITNKYWHYKLPEIMKTFFPSSTATFDIKLISKKLFCAITAICFSGNLLAHDIPANDKISHSRIKKAAALVNPSISYNSPQNYFKGNVITPLSPVSTGVSALGYSTSLAGFGSGFSAPTGVATDAAGNVYVADYNNSVVKKIPAGGGAITTVGSGFSFPSGVAVDVAGNVYVADYGNGLVKEILASNGSTISLGSGFSRPQAVAVDGAGNVFVADYSNSQVTEIPIGGGAQINIGSGINEPYGVAVDNAGNVYIASHGFGQIIKVPAGGGAQSVVGTGGVYGVATDAGGNLFYTDYSTGALTELLANGGGTTIISSSFTHPSGVAIDYKGNLYVTDAGVSKIVPVGGYFISQFLPKGLSFDSSTGIISGTPTVLSPTTNYTVTGYNSTGSSSAVLSLQVTSLSFSYPSPLIFTNNVTISPVSPTVTGTVAASAYNTTANNFASGFVHPRGVSIDRSGNVFISDYGTGSVTKLPAGGGSPVPFGSGFTGAVGTASDFAGNVYVCDYNQNKIFKVPVGGGSPTQIGTGYNGAIAIAADAKGNVFIADYGNGAIDQISPAGVQSTFATGFTNPSGVAVDSLGFVYVADYTTSLVTKISADGLTKVTLGSGLHNPYGLTVDPTGNIFIADYNHDSIVEFPVSGGAPVALVNSFSVVTGVAVDAVGNLLVTDYGNPKVLEIKPSGGYYLNTALPAGLTFSKATGTISGTPIVLTAATNYTVTAYNGSASNSAVVNIKVSVPAITTLTNLAISSGTLSPVFATGTTGYSASVGNAISSITITPTATDPLSTIKVNGVSVTSGSASGALPLTVGPNTITTVVTAQDGVTTKTYSITVTRAASANANLVSLHPSSGALSPAFAAATTSYSVAVANSVTSVTIIPQTGVATSTVTVNGSAVASGVASPAIPLNVGPNIITTIVTAENGITTKTYTMTVARAASVNANLASLQLSKGTLSPVFAAATTSYTVSVANTVTLLTVTPTTSVNTATVTVNGTAVSSGTPSAAIPLNVGPNTITTTVTAEDGITTKTYTLTVNRPASNNDNLTSMGLSAGALTPAFAAATSSYTVNVVNGVASITVTPTASDPDAVIKVNGTTVASGTASAPVALSVGLNAIQILVTASNNITAKTYTITVTRAASVNANLSAFKINRGALTPAFSTITTGYSASVVNGVTSMTVTPTTTDATATVTVNGIAVTSGTASGPITLAIGPNTITTIVTAQDGITTKTYTLTVTRATGTVPIAANSFDPGISVNNPGENKAPGNDGIVVHQGITPNGDGINDFLQIDNIAQYPDNKVSIINRNGQLVYEARGYDNSSKVFDGRSNKNGQMQLPGTYFYQLDYTANGVTKHKTGYLVLKY